MALSHAEADFEMKQVTSGKSGNIHNDGSKRTTFKLEGRGPSDQHVPASESSGRQPTEGKDSLLEYLTNMGGEEREQESDINSPTEEEKSKLSTAEMRERVKNIRRLRTPEESKMRENFVSDLLEKDSDDDDTLDGDLSVSTATIDGKSLFPDNASVLSEDYSQRSTMIDSMLANVRSRRPASAGCVLSESNLSLKQDLERNGVLFIQSPTGATIPITHDAPVSREDACAAISSKQFEAWIHTSSKSYGAKRFSIMKMTILNVDRNELGHVGTIKIEVEGKLRDEEARRSWKNIKEICLLRQETLGLLVSLICIEDGSQWSLLVDRPSLPIGRPTALELPSITFDNVSSTYLGDAIRPMRHLCDVEVDEHELINLAEETYNEKSGLTNVMGLTPDPAKSSESFKFLYLSKRVTKKKLQQIRKNTSEARQEGVSESASLWVIPTNDIWKVSTDMKVMWYVCDEYFYLLTLLKLYFSSP
jgi:hypothetical protein